MPAGTFWNDSFEVGTTGYAIVPGMVRDCSRSHSGGCSLREDFLGNHIQGGGYSDRSHPKVSELWTRTWFYLPSGFLADPSVPTKMFLLGESAYYPSYWVVMSPNSTSIAIHAQGVGDASGSFSNGTVNVIYGSSIPKDRWVCIETHIRNGTAGGSDGVIEGWIDGQQAMHAGGLRLRASTLTPICQGCGINSPTAGFELARHYVQYGGPGSLWYDDFAVGSTRIGCN